MIPDVLPLVRVLAALAVVLALAVIALRFVLPRLQGLQTREARRIEVVEVRLLDRQHRVALLRVGRRELLVAFGQGSAATLGSWPAGLSGTGCEEERA